MDSLLGWGSTSAVYAATHRNGHRAALKVIHQSLCGDRAACERFLREAGIVNAVKHRAMVPVRDDGVTEDGCAYLVLELLEGDTLEALCERNGGRLEIEDLAPIAEELMSAIAAVHAAGIVHRDLKPQNVFLTKSELKLLDFGTARIFDNAQDPTVSTAGVVVGTPAFMSPEQALGDRDAIDAQSDVWSLGAMLFTVLTGELVHEGKDAHARLLAAASKPARKIADVAPSVDHRIATVIDRALMFDKESRWNDVRSMRLAFRDAVIGAVPTMRDLKAYADVLAEDEAPPPPSLTDPTLVMSAPPSGMEQRSSLPPDVGRLVVTPIATVVPVTSGRGGENEASQNEGFGVSATNRFAPVGTTSWARFALYGVAAAAAAAAVFVVLSAVTANDAHRSDASATAAAYEPPGAMNRATSGGAEPAPSFIVITAPDVPGEKNEKKKVTPAWTAPPDAKPRGAAAGKANEGVTTDAGAATTSRASDAAPPTATEPAAASTPTEAPSEGNETPEGTTEAP